jgi:hypothetical protein
LKVSGGIKNAVLFKGCSGKVLIIALSVSKSHGSGGMAFKGIEDYFWNLLVVGHERDARASDVLLI